MDTQDLAARAASRLDAERTARLDAITALGSAAAHVSQVRADLAAAEKAHTDAYAKAQRLGWTDADIRDLGIDQPGKKPAGRPRAPRDTPRKQLPAPTHTAGQSQD